MTQGRQCGKSISSRKWPKEFNLRFCACFAIVIFGTRGLSGCRSLGCGIYGFGLDNIPGKSLQP